jgi:hypothetical protein
VRYAIGSKQYLAVQTSGRHLHPVTFDKLENSSCVRLRADANDRHREDSRDVIRARGAEAISERAFFVRNEIARSRPQGALGAHRESRRGTSATHPTEDRARARSLRPRTRRTARRDQSPLPTTFARAARTVVATKTPAIRKDDGVERARQLIAAVRAALARTG